MLDKQLSSEVQVNTVIAGIVDLCFELALYRSALNDSLA